jgi:preprotein translocase subunit SecY
MGNPEYLFSDHIECPNCESELSLNDEEQRGSSVICPSCYFLITHENVKRTSATHSTDQKPHDNIHQLFTMITTVGPMRDKVLFTLGAISIYRIGLYIPIPGVNTHAVSELLATTGHHSGSTLFSQGIMPYVLGATIILLLSAVIPPLRRLRDGDEMQHQKFDRIIYLTVFLWSVFQAWGSYNHIEGIYIAGQYLADKDLGSQLLYVVTLSTSTMILVWIADRITQKGLANGIAIFVLSDFLFSIYPLIKNIDIALSEKLLSYGGVLILFCIGIVIIVLSMSVVTSKRFIALERVNENTNQASPPFLPVRVMVSGILPFTIALSIMAIPQYLFSLGYMTAWYLIPYGILVILFSYLFVAITYDPNDIIGRLRRYGYAVAGATTDDEAKMYIDRTLIRTILPGMLFVLLLTVLPIIIFAIYGTGSPFFSKEVLVIAAISIPIVQSFRQQLRATTTSVGIAQQIDDSWVLIFSADTMIEGELVKDILAGAAINAQIVAERVICTTGSLAPWEICRPRFPAIMIHPRLANGSVDVYVQPEFASQANDILIQRHIISKGEPSIEESSDQVETGAE